MIPPRAEPAAAAAPLAERLIEPVVVRALRTASVALPLYNEAAGVPRLVRTLVHFARENPQYEFIVVDDGSGDGTGAALQMGLAAAGAAPPNLVLVSYPENRGKGSAIRAAFEQVHSPLFCFLDGDLAYPLDHVHRLVAALAEHDVVIGSRALVSGEDLEVRLTRRIMGRAFNGIARRLLDLPWRDTQAGVKGFRTDAARRLFARSRLEGFAFDAEMLFIARRMGLRVGQIPAEVCESHRRKASGVNLVLDPPRMLAQLVGVRLNGYRGRYD